MKFTDAKLPCEFIEIGIREETMGDLIEIYCEGSEDGALIYLTKDKAREMGELLIELSNQIELS